jgi:hypothetical protein
MYSLNIVLPPLLTFSQGTNFKTVDRIIALVLTLHQTQGLEPRITIDDRPVMDIMVKKVGLPDIATSLLSETTFISFSYTCDPNAWHIMSELSI